MVAKKLVLGIGIMVSVLAVVGTVISPTNVVWGATILCPVAPGSGCIGTEESDNLIGNDVVNNIDGRGDNDVITAKGGDDNVHGRAGNDIINGGKGLDGLAGEQGSDLISGGEDNDEIFHNFASINTDAQTKPDGSRDRIDCGPGDDVAWINVSVDHDLAVNCEKVNAG